MKRCRSFGEHLNCGSSRCVFERLVVFSRSRVGYDAYPFPSDKKYSGIVCDGKVRCPEIKIINSG